MFSASEDDMRRPPEIMEMLKIPTNNLMPKKFRDRYECLSNIYELERKDNIKSFSENVLLVYFEDNSNSMKPSAKIMRFC
jgi:hypothetical protein